MKNAEDQLKLLLLELFFRKRRWRALIAAHAPKEVLELAWSQVSKAETDLEARLPELQEMHADLMVTAILEKAVA